jgi:hypothetical protein
MSFSTRSSSALERVLAQHGALGLVVELQVDPVDGVVALALLGPRMNSPRNRARVVWGGWSIAVDVVVGADPLDQARGPAACRTGRARG